jgi:hypothetical protein
VKKCQFCAEDIQDAAIVCKHCGRDLKGTASGTVKVHQADWISTTAKWGVGLFAILIALMILSALFR